MKFAGDDARDAQACIKSVQTSLQHPTRETVEAAYNLSITAPDEETSPALSAAQRAGLAAYRAQYNDVRSVAREGSFAARYGAMAAHHDAHDNMRDSDKVYDKTLAKYKSWASAYHANPTQSHVNKQEIAMLMDKDGNYLPYLLDYLEENGMKPSNLTLQQFGVKDFSSNKEIAQQILESGMLSGFYRAISNSLAKII